MQELSRPEEAVEEDIGRLEVLPVVDAGVILIHELYLLPAWRSRHVEGGSGSVVLTYLHEVVAIYYQTTVSHLARIIEDASIVK